MPARLGSSDGRLRPHFFLSYGDCRSFLCAFLCCLTCYKQSMSPILRSERIYGLYN